MATLSGFNITPAGDTATFVPADAAGDEFQYDRRAVLILDNSAGASAKAVTVASFFPDQPGAAPADVTITVEAGAIEIAGNFGEKVFADADDMIQLTYDDATDLRVAVGIK